MGVGVCVVPCNHKVLARPCRILPYHKFVTQVRSVFLVLNRRDIWFWRDRYSYVLRSMRVAVGLSKRGNCHVGLHGVLPFSVHTSWFIHRFVHLDMADLSKFVSL